VFPLADVDVAFDDREEAIMISYPSRIISNLRCSYKSGASTDGREEEEGDEVPTPPKNMGIGESIEILISAGIFGIW
jgi:hypothetical protein